MTRSFIVGTAGHIDHGKTSLVRALTGTDTDRLAEEKRRGITIELGFAHLDLGPEDGLDPPARLGIVDVPGHERFIKAMVAGAGGVDLALLVIAADEGVMPQTREHLDICRLLGVRRGVVALTKRDLVDDDWLELAADDVRSVLEGSGLDDAAIVPCSAQSGAGIDALRREIAAVVRALPDRQTDGPLRLPLDRVFTIKGFGTIVTGSLVSGRVAAGEQVEVLPTQQRAPVRRVQVHGDSVEAAVAGQRTALNLGGVDREALARGEVVAHPGTIACSPMLDVEVELLPSTRSAFKPRTKVLFHLGTRQQQASCVLLGDARLEAGQRGLAQLRFDTPVVAMPGDRFVLRGFAKQENYGTTVGGGRVLRVLARKIKPRDTDAIARLRELAALPDEHGAAHVAHAVREAGAAGIGQAGLRTRLPLGAAALRQAIDALVADGTVVRFDEQNNDVVYRDEVDAMRAQLLEMVDAHHERNPLELGVSRAELHSRLPRGVNARLFAVLLDALVASGELVSADDVCHRPTHGQRMRDALGPAADKIAAIYRDAGLGPPWESDLDQTVDAPADTIAAALRLLLAEGVLVRVQTLLFHREHLQALEQRLRDYLATHGEIRSPDFKAMVGQSRKYFIPLAEHFDAQHVTVRDGDVRRLR